MLLLWISLIHNSRPMGNGFVVPVRPLAVHRLRGVPGVIEGMDIVGHARFPVEHKIHLNVREGDNSKRVQIADDYVGWDKLAAVLA